MSLPGQGMIVCLGLFMTVFVSQAVAAPHSQDGAPQPLPSAAEQLFALANQTRGSYRLGSLKWDPALAAAALQHCNLMADMGSISHRYQGEPDLTVRAGQAGAHFSLVEENVAVGPYVDGIHQGWMNSPGHRENLLNPQIDRVGVAVVARGGSFYAVADYARAVPVLSRNQIEAAVAGLLHDRGLSIASDASQARAYCASSAPFKGSGARSALIRWESADVTQLPSYLAQRAASGEYRAAAVGSCPTQGTDGTFTVYRVAVLLYSADAGALP
jgi:Cysteine-rich secretory protein family